MPLTLRTFTPYSPSELLNGKTGEWIILALFVVLFIAISGAVLPRRLTGGRFGKALIITLGSILGLGLFKARHLFHFNFESFGFLAIALIILLLSFVTYGMMRIGFRKDISIALSYCLMYLTFALVTPSLYDAFAEHIPILNGIFLLGFIYLAGNLLFKLFGVFSTDKIDKASSLLRNQPPADAPEIEQEIEEEEKEEFNLKKRIMALTKQEIKTVKDLENAIRDMIKIVQAHQTLGQVEFQILSQTLTKIARSKKIFEDSLLKLKTFIENNEIADKRELEALKGRLRSVKEDHKQKEILQEIKFEDAKIKIYAFLNAEEKRITQFLRFFESIMYKASQFLRRNQPTDALIRLKEADKELNLIRDTLIQLKKYEFLALKYSKKEKKIMKKEKKGK